ncbi:hypothetical protein DICVIV_09961 [Dictyocaulus viviparus]|uniref:ACAD9/ACADV-like C-terminal domain-containing protein n=1 Tax=Dictyocaulus viviparus TaxID=29172 RepID=A0A0D8XH60_DICVI|nr:hypothetical protein DICVIV_09961 [Dictyocaulus viviparus]
MLNLNIDWNIYANIAIVNSAINVLLLYGTEEMKKKYFPMIIEGKFRPIITIVDDTSINSCSHVTGTSPVNSMLFVNKKASIALSNPNVAILFATSEDRQVSDISICLLQLVTIKWLAGLDKIREELLSSTCLPLAAATIGYGKRLLRDLAAICNKTPSARKNNIMMSNENASQYATTEFALKLYVLESTSYYLAGMLDEKMPITLDIENALIHRMTRDVLLSSIATCMNLAGVRAIDLSFQFEKDIRDVTTLLSLTCNELTVEDISIAALSSWSTSNFLNRLLRLDQLEGQLKNPKLTHFIAEHAHPSLQMACQELEFSISRVNVVISKLLEKQGKNIKHDYTTHEQLVRVLQNHFAMLAVISRSSRSYCIGLRNGDLELAWATSICSRLSRENLSSLEMLNDHFELLRLNPSLLNVGRAIFDMGGYQLESPIERNW